MNVSPLYDNLPSDLEKHLRHSVNIGLDGGSGSAAVFFRADDIAVPSAGFAALTNLFKQYRVPLCLAVVPSWLTIPRFRYLKKITGGGRQWCWHQHGWQHCNHEISGKKQEFGNGRSAARQLSDLKKGWQRLQEIMGHDAKPYFTPPWNRCSTETLTGLSDLGFLAVSRSINARPQAPASLPDIQVTVDLHTRKETDPALALNNLLQELKESMSAGRVGIMIHHQRMDARAVDFLSLLLQVLKNQPQLQFADFEEMLPLYT